MAFITYVEEVDNFRGIRQGDKCIVTKRQENSNLVFVTFLEGACKGQTLGMDIRQISSEEE